MHQVLLKCLTLQLAPSGLASVVLPAVRILDSIYAARVTIEALKQRYGMGNSLWPESVVESLRDRHNQVFKQIEEHIGALPANLYYPLGEAAQFMRLGARPANLKACQAQSRWVPRLPPCTCQQVRLHSLRGSPAT